MKKSLLLSSAAVLGALFIASPASALTVTGVKGTGVTNGGTTVELDLGNNGSIEESYSYYLGSFNLTIDGSPNIVAFCLDLLDSINLNGTTEYTYSETTTPFDDNPLTSGTVDQLKDFFDYNYSGLSTAVEFAGFQLGLWEIVYDGVLTGSEDYFVDGQLTASASDTDPESIIGKATKFLNNMFLASVTGDYDLTFLESASDPGPDKQDLVYAVESASAEVPLPAAFWLLGGGVIGLFGFGRFKKTAKATA